MKAFSKLFAEIDQTTSLNEKTDALIQYFSVANPEDAIWAVAMLMGKRPKRALKVAELWNLCAEQVYLPSWLISESYHIVGDMAETISLILPQADEVRDYSLNQIMNDLINLQSASETDRLAYVKEMWKHLVPSELFLFNKLITGGFRVGVSDKIVIKALARYFNIDENLVAHKLTGTWDPQQESLSDLLSTDGVREDLSKPYPFYLSYPLEGDPEELGDINDWFIERKYDGIRGQIIIRENQLFIWSRGEDLLTDKFVEFHSLPAILPNGTVIDGEILAFKDGIILPFHVMQTRTGRKNLTKKALEEAPLTMICYDLIEVGGVDVRHLPLHERRSKLEELLSSAKQKLDSIPLQISPLVNAQNWIEALEERRKAREYNSEGLMLKRKTSEYKVGRKKGDWWKWKVDPFSIDGVLIYAQRGHGRRADMYTDFTFGVWDGEELVPFAKAYSGLTDKELADANAWIKRNTNDKFGPVRSVTPMQVFEIGFEGINPSPRHKAGIALRFPRILRWRKDKSIKDANTKNDLLELLKLQK